MSVVGLFAGIGGFELAFSRVGFHTAMLVEIDAAARSVLSARFPDAEIKVDVADLHQLPPGTSIVTAGFPCQNLSMAGDKTGIKGTQSSVVGKLFDLIAASEVPTVVIENVPFMLRLDSGSGMRWLVEQFERLEYPWAYRVLDTMGFGLPQRRRRVYLVASREIDPRRVLFADDLPIVKSPKPTIKEPLGFFWTEGRSGVGFTIDGIPPLKVGSSIGIPSAPAVLFPDGQVLMPSLSACEKLQGFDPGWTDIENKSWKPRLAWRMVGNAVSVPVARWIGARIASPGELLSLDTQPLTDGDPWPNAAWGTLDAREKVTASDKPIGIRPPSISAFRDGSWTLLSDRALDGFIGRAEEGGLKMPDGFLDALRDAPRKEKKPTKGRIPYPPASSP